MNGQVQTVVPVKYILSQRGVVTTLFGVATLVVIGLTIAFPDIFVLTGPVFLVTSTLTVLAYLSILFHPVRVEFNGPKLSVYYRNRFRYYNLDDLVEIKPARTWQRQQIFTPRPVYRLKFRDGRTLLLVDDSKKPGELGIALSRWAPDILRKQCELTLPYRSRGGELNLLMSFVILGIGLITIYSSIATHKVSWHLNLPLLAMFFFRKQDVATVELRDTDIVIGLLSTRPTCPYDQVETIEITHNESGYEKMKVTGVKGTISFTCYSSDHDYPAIRDFLLKKCRNAKLIGLDAPDDLILCSLTRVSGDEPQDQPNLQTTSLESQTQQPNPTVTT